jgi:type III secretion protein T
MDQVALTTGHATESYLTLYLNSAYLLGEEMTIIALMFLFFGRMLPIIALAPFLGGRVLTNPAKIFLALTLFVIFLPQLSASLTQPIPYDSHLFLLLVKELFIGLSIGFMISMPFTIVTAAGMIIDHQRGGASLMVNDPTIQNQSSPIGTFFNMVLIYVFFSIDGPFFLFDSIARSYEIIPPDQFFNPNFFAKDSPFWLSVIKLFNQVMVISIQMCTPALLAILMTDVFLGIANRLAPQVQITFLGMPLKSLLGLAVVAFGWNLMVEAFIFQSHFWLNAVNDMIKLFKPAGG